ncbi:MAG: GNAT family N-acetyltransferase [Ottowia sp.]|jgi:RimJ/RimL family protein N-acetyltransferase|nr:GNAT family N-acetyltransferase [Ottowia sp.]
MNIVLETSRLYLRHWQVQDRPHFAAINADPEVMRYLPRILTNEQSDVLANCIVDAITSRGIGFWALQTKSENCFIGFVGLSYVDDTLPCAPTVEIGWRLAKHAWGKGYASEAARACLALGFNTYQWPEIVAFTATENQRSRAVMSRIGMTYNAADDFDHPMLSAGHHLQRHVLYRLKNSKI